MTTKMPRSNDYVTIEIASERALILYVQDRGDMAEFIKAFYLRLKALQINSNTHCQNITEIIPSFNSLLVIFDPLTCELQLLITELLSIASGILVLPKNEGKIIKLPVFYDERYGLDLPHIAQQAHLSIAEVITLHQQTTYHVKSIGFAPGFAYLGDVNSSIATPRLPTPRVQVPKGAVAIANNQTAVYPQASPGGWNLIGLCPTTLFDAKSETPLLFEVGDKVQFYAIEEAEFLQLGGELPIQNVLRTQRNDEVTR